MTEKRKISKPLYIFLIMTAVLISCSGRKTNETEDISPAVEIFAGRPVIKNMQDYIGLNATTRYLKQEIVRSTLQGFIERNYKSIGDRINPGDVLFLIKTKEASFTDSINFKVGNSDFTGNVRIKAKTGGILTELFYQAGDYIADGEQLALIVDPSSLRIMVNVPYKYDRFIRINDVFDTRFPDGSSYKARVVGKIPEVDPASQTQSYILVINKKNGIPANLNLIVSVPVKTEKNALALPKSAVMANEIQTEFWVMKIINDSTAVKMPVVKGIENDSLVQVVSPVIDTNERFIIDGAFGLPDTAAIKIHN